VRKRGVEIGYVSLRAKVLRSSTPGLGHYPSYSATLQPPGTTNHEEKRLTGVDDDQDPLPPLVDLCKLPMLGVEYRGIEVEVVLQSFVSLDDDGSLGILGDFGGKVRHVECV
jgi:hypothetical protein